MVKLLTFSSVVLSLTLAGCSPGIIDTPPDTSGKAAEYFWPSTSGSVVYERDSVNSPRTRFTLNFSGDGDRTTIVSKGATGKSDTFIVHTSDEGVFLEGSTGGNLFFPMPANYVITSSSDSESVEETVPREIERVLVTGPNSLMAVDKEHNIFYSPNRTDWSKIYWRGGEISSWTVVGEGASSIIYIGTSAGELYRSTDQTMSWDLLTKEDAPITAIAAASDTIDAVFYAVKGSAVKRRGIRSDVDTVIDGNTRLDDVTALAIAGLNPGPFTLVAGTADQGVLTAAVYPEWGRWVSSTSQLTKRSLAMVSNRKILFALCESSGTKSLLSSSTFGSTWEQATTTTLSEHTSVIAYDGSKYLLTATDDNAIVSRFATLQGATAKYEDTALINAEKIYDLSAGYGIFAAATDKGIFVSTTGKGWSRIEHSLLTEKVIRKVPAPGSLRLLTGGTDALDSGKTWVAASGLIKTLALPFTIYGKVRSKLSSLVLPNAAGEYQDVIPVIYQLSSNTESLRIVVYYAHNIGPVLIEQYIGSNVPVRIYRVSD